MEGWGGGEEREIDYSEGNAKTGLVLVMYLEATLFRLLFIAILYPEYIISSNRTKL